MREIKHLNTGIYHVHGSEDSVFLKCHFFSLNWYINKESLIKIIADSFCGNYKADSKWSMKMPPRVAKTD